MSASASGGLPRAVPLLMGARFARAVGQGALVVGFTLYLHALGWGAASIGAVLSAALFVAVLLTLLVGPASDRFGRRRFLLAYESVALLSALLALCSTQPWVLGLGALLGGFGRGANGAAGPFGPLEQAWLAQDLAPSDRPRVFSLNAALGFWGMAVGALLAALPALWQRELPGALAFRPLFVLPLLGSMIGMWLVWKAPEHHPHAAPRDPASHDHAAAQPARREQNRMLLRLAVANGFNGLGIGMVAPWMAYWYALRFGHGPASIGPALAGSFVCAALGAQLARHMSRRFGLVDTVVYMRAVGLALLLLTPLSPWFGLAAVAWAVRSAFNRGTIGVRQALVVGLTDERRRGLAATVNNVSVMVPRAIGPALSGLMLARGWLIAPFLVAGVFQGAYLLAYRGFFGGIDAARP
ncbi:MAG: MFS transporter [Betaproteobacteria bacterium]|nr:MFS transporter [Betaproteobacteria bacterium]MDE2152553.1 MFS transporter [Betaproteobacteria bacterium]